MAKLINLCSLLVVCIHTSSVMSGEDVGLFTQVTQQERIGLFPSLSMREDDIVTEIRNSEIFEYMLDIEIQVTQIRINMIT